MTTFKELAEAWIASREHCSGSLGRIRFWVDEFGPLQVDQISAIAFVIKGLPNGGPFYLPDFPGTLA